MIIRVPKTENSLELSEEKFHITDGFWWGQSIFSVGLQFVSSFLFSQSFGSFWFNNINVRMEKSFGKLSNVHLMLNKRAEISLVF